MQPTHAPADIKAITSLRFFAAFAVLVLHYRDMFGPLEPWVLRGIVGGQYGVTFFFILSGFILTYRYEEWFEGGVPAATVGASVLCYRFIEVPARRRLRGQRGEGAASALLTGHSPAAVPSSA